MIRIGKQSDMRDVRGNFIQIKPDLLLVKGRKIHGLLTTVFAIEAIALMFDRFGFIT